VKTRFDGHSGPWHWFDYGVGHPDDWRVYIDPGNEEFTVAKIFSRSVSTQDRELLRSAPDLLRVACELAEALEATQRHNGCVGGNPKCHDCQRFNAALAAFHNLVDPDPDPREEPSVCGRHLIRAAVKETRREMMLPCAACAERGEVVTRRMNTEPGDCPHGYAFDCCTQCHEAFHAGRAEENKRWSKRVREWAWDPQAPEAYRSAWKHILFELEQKDSATAEATAEPERGAP
jgi:hypothetical protein